MSLRKEIKDRLYSSHLAYDSMMRRARTTVFWPGMSSEIKNLADSCEACQAIKPSNQKETLVHHTPDTSQPWEKVGCDLMEISGRQYLITVDYATNFIEADYLTSITARTVINKLKAHFARYGVPKLLISDCGSQFTSQEFQMFAKKWCFRHKTSSPGHHKSNGRAESAVKIIKQMMKKSLQQGQDQYEALLELRNTPRQYADAPAEAMFQRKIRTLIPRLCDQDKKSHSKPERQDSVSSSYNKHAKDLPQLNHEQPVYYQNPEQSTWNKGKVMRRLGLRDYEIQGENGGHYRRNRVHLRPKTTAFNPEPEEELHFPDVEDEQTIQAAPDLVPSQAIDLPAPQARPKRTIKKPIWAKDYVMS